MEENRCPSPHSQERRSVFQIASPSTTDLRTQSNDEPRDIPPLQGSSNSWGGEEERSRKRSSEAGFG